MRIFFLLFFIALLPACQTMQRAQQAAFTPRQVAVLEQQGFEQAGDDWQFGMADRLLFDTDQSALIPTQKSVIGGIASALVKVGINGARVEGHTDSVGKAAYNDALSTRRAQAVADALILGGITPQALRIAGMGARIPIESNQSASGRRENRRVVIIVSPSDAEPIARP